MNENRVRTAKRKPLTLRGRGILKETDLKKRSVRFLTFKSGIVRLEQLRFDPLIFLQSSDEKVWKINRQNRKSEFIKKSVG